MHTRCVRKVPRSRAIHPMQSSLKCAFVIRESGIQGLKVKHYQTSIRGDVHEWPQYLWWLCAHGESCGSICTARACVALNVRSRTKCSQSCCRTESTSTKSKVMQSCCLLWRELATQWRWKAHSKRSSLSLCLQSKGILLSRRGYSTLRDHFARARALRQICIFRRTVD